MPKIKDKDKEGSKAAPGASKKNPPKEPAKRGRKRKNPPVDDKTGTTTTPKKATPAPNTPGTSTTTTAPPTNTTSKPGPKKKAKAGKDTKEGTATTAGTGTASPAGSTNSKRSTPTKQTKAKKPKAPAKPKEKPPVDVEKQCGVELPNGGYCARSLTCKTHSMGAKRAVQGRSQPYDVLLQAYQKRNQVKQASLSTKQQLNAENEALKDDTPLDRDEEIRQVLQGVQAAVPVPLERRVIMPVRSKTNFFRSREMLLKAVNNVPPLPRPGNNMSTFQYQNLMIMSSTSNLLGRTVVFDAQNNGTSMIRPPRVNVQPQHQQQQQPQQQQQNQGQAQAQSPQNGLTPQQLAAYRQRLQAQAQAQQAQAARAQTPNKQ